MNTTIKSPIGIYCGDFVFLMFGIMPVELFESDTFEKEVLDSNEPVLVDFWAPWCGPCKMIAPLMDEIAKEMKGVKIGKLNIDEYSDIAQQYSVMSIPTLLFFKNGRVMDQMIGIQTKSTIKNKLEELK